MATDDKKRLKLEKDLVLQKKEEAKIQKQINDLIKDGADEMSDTILELDRQLDTEKEIQTKKRHN